MRLYTSVGVFVCFEGGDGSGKSTQSRVLGEWLEGATLVALYAIIATAFWWG